MRPRAIELHIEELVLHGFPAGDRMAIGAAVERELTRLLRERGVPESLATGAVRESIDAGAFSRTSQATPSAVGDAVARSVFGGLEK